MPCCKCEEHYWSDPQPVKYTDVTGQKYCLFHAPAEHKGMSVDKFNAQVFARIDAFKAKPKTSDEDERCDLYGTIFPGDIYFRAYGADNPLPDICFVEATFDGWAVFGKATFGGEVDFENATFSGGASFGDATFSGGASFGGATFSGGAYFSQATFSDWTSFAGVKAEKNALWMHTLNGTTLANLYFTSMDTECFSFKGCDWPEKLWPETQEKPDHKACEELYRSLKQKAADEHDQPLVSKWHYREKLMALEQLKAKRGWRGRLGLTGLYYWCSGFGEDPVQAFRVLAWLLGFALLALSGFKLWETGIHPQFAWDKILEIPAEWLALIPFVKNEAKATVSLGGVFAPVKAIVTGVLHILFAAQIALFAFALRNRFRR